MLDPHLIASAVLSVAPNSSTAFTALMFAGMVEAQLQADRVGVTNTGGFFGPGFVVAIASVPEVMPGLQSIFRLLESHKPLNHYPREIAYFDRDELIWRTAFPAQPLAPFERFLTPSIIAASQEQLQADMGFIRNVIQHQSQL